MRRILILGALLFAAGARVEAQDQKRMVSLPTNYDDCLRPNVLELLVNAGPKTWGLSKEQHNLAFRAVQGYFLCHAYAGRGEESCGTLQGMPDFEHSPTMGIECRADYNVLKVHEALRVKDEDAAVRFCSRWCRLNKSEEDKKMVCPNVCRLAVKELQVNRNAACEKTMRTVAKSLGAGAEYAREATLFCRQKFSPQLSDCSAKLGPNTPADCKAMVALLGAYAREDEKLCPKDALFSGVCRAMIINRKMMVTASTGKIYDGPEAFSACNDSALIFTKMFCDSYKSTGGLQEIRERPKREGY